MKIINQKLLLSCLAVFLSVSSKAQTNPTNGKEASNAKPTPSAINALVSNPTPNFNCGGTRPALVNLSKLGAGSNANVSGATCTASSAAYTSKYSLQSFYVPVANDPLLTVLVDFHIFNDATGGGSFPNTAQSITQLQQIAAWMDPYSQMSNPRNATYTTPGFVSPYNQDSRVHYVLNKIYFYSDPASYLNTTTNDGDLMNAIIAQDPKRLTEALPILFNNANLGGASAYQAFFTTPTGISGVPYIHTSDSPPPNTGLWWSATAHLPHELGHCMGLYHTYFNGMGDESQYFPCGSPNFLSDVFPQNNGCTGAMGCGICQEVIGGVAPAFASNNLMSGNNDNSWMSPLQQGRRIKNLHLNPVRIYVQEMTSGYLNPWNITANETWDFDIQMYQDIVVQSGATLTIKCKVAMADAGRIIVQRGAKLVIDGGTVSAWGSNWAGIQVWGTSNQPQTVVGGMSANHGIVQVINQGTIQDAVNGITTIKYDQTGNIDWGGYTGGIIYCDGANFINNQRAIQYMSYHNTNPVSHLLMSNVGYVKNSLFQTNSSMKTANFPPLEFVSMWDVQGLQYLGNTYQNTTSPQPSIDKLGIGFYSEDASYTIDRYQVCSVINTVTGLCASYSANNPSTFTNLQYGVDVNNVSTVVNVKVNNNDFVACNRAVLMNNSNNSTVTNNRINVGAGQNTPSFLPYGIYMQNSTGYNVSNNNITTTQWPDYHSSIATGIWVNSSISTPNLINLNTITKMSAGVGVLGNNYGVNPGDGLQLKCNIFGQGTNGKNYQDMFMAYVSSTWTDGRIGNYQGSLSQGANNIFSHTGGVITDSDYGDVTAPSPANSVSYYYNGGNTTVQPLYYDASLHPLLATGAYSSSLCNPSTGGGGTTGGSGRMAFTSNQTLINESLSKIDGGETQALLNNVAVSGKATQATLVNKLLAASPYLSDAVLEQYLRRDNNTATDVQQIILANSPVSHQIKQLVDGLDLDNATRTAINDAQVGVSKREVLYSSIADLNEQASLLYNDAMQSLLNDPNGLDKDAIIQLMKADNSAGANARLRSALTFFGDDKNAAALVDPTSTDNYNKVQSIILQLKTTPEGIFALKNNKSLTQTLTQIANMNATGDLGVSNAQAILHLVFGTKYQEFVALPNAGEGQVGTTSKVATTETAASIIEASKLMKIYPNPTSGTTNVYFTTAQKYTVAEVAVYDGLGNLIVNQRLNGSACVLNTEALNAGLYLITLSFDGVVTEKQKLIKQ